MATVRVNVLRAGIWRSESGGGYPTVITPADCAEVVSNFALRPHGLSPALRHRHPADGFEGKAAGLVAELKLHEEGADTYVEATIVGVDGELAAAMARGEQNVSAEIFPDYAKVNRLRCSEGKKSSDVLGMVLRGVALIGTDEPGIKGLGPARILDAALEATT
jgi:hypothetical protein